MKEALFYEKKDGEILCMLCPHSCRIKNLHTGKCTVRKNIDHKLYSLNYGKISALNIDPIEKKPLYYFLPGTYTLSLGSYGCNLSCQFCQNYHISKKAPQTENKSPEDIVNLAEKLKLPSVSYTYNEPSVYYEFVMDTAKLANKKGIKNIMVTNGFIQEEPLKMLLPEIQAMNIDLKSFSEKSYAEICGGSREPVKRTIQLAAEKCHVEITTLLVTGMNDDEEELDELFRWIAGINPQIPLHLSRYFPMYKYNQPPTDIVFMRKMKEKAGRYLKYVYLGNV